MRSIRKSACALTGALAVSAIPSLASAQLNVYGSTPYIQGVGGIQSAVIFPGQGTIVNSSGVAVGFGFAVNASNDNVGSRGLKWEASPATPVVLPSLGIAPGGVSGDGAFAINVAGTIAGYATKIVNDVSQGLRGVRWAPDNTPEELLPISYQTGEVGVSQALSINDVGTAVGASVLYISGNDMGTRPVRWAPNSNIPVPLATFGEFNGVVDGGAYGINGAGTMYGFIDAMYPNGDSRGRIPVRWDSSGAIVSELQQLGSSNSGESFGTPSDINAFDVISGVVVEFDSGVDIGTRAVRWDAGTDAVTELLGAGDGSVVDYDAQATGINDAGTIVGASQKSEAGSLVGTRALRWDAGNIAPVELGNLGLSNTNTTESGAFGIDEAGNIVGYAGVFSGGVLTDLHATYWPAGSTTPIDLNTLIDPASGWILQVAYGISPFGDYISGQGTFDPDGLGGQAPYTRLFVLGVPEPTSLAMLVGSGAAMLLRRRRVERIA